MSDPIVCGAKMCNNSSELMAKAQTGGICIRRYVKIDRKFR
jgi:hypothetical protein